jgi:hypothetical protein
MHQIDLENKLKDAQINQSKNNFLIKEEILK